MLHTNKETTRSGVGLQCMPERDTMVEDRIRRQLMNILIFKGVISLKKIHAQQAKKHTKTTEADKKIPT
jgi:hypothetical protein